MKLLFKFTEVEVDQVAEDGLFTGYASRFDEVDQGGDIVRKGAYAGTLKRRKAKMLFNHDPSNVIGHWKAMKEDETGLRVEGKLNLEHSLGRDVYANVKQGEVSGLSIGYQTIRSKQISDGRELLELDLWEVSLVTFPMQVSAGIDAVKNLRDVLEDNPALFKRNLEKSLRDGGFSASDAKTAVSGAFEALKGARDAAVEPDQSVFAIMQMLKAN